MYKSVILLTRRSTRKVRITVVAADGLTKVCRHDRSCGCANRAAGCISLA